MPAKKIVAHDEVSVYKDDGVWFAEINDWQDHIRFTFTNDAAVFVRYVVEMLDAMDLTLDEIKWVTVDETAEGFLKKALGKTRKRKKVSSSEDPKIDSRSGHQ